MIRYRHIVSAIALAICFATTVSSAATPVVAATPAVISTPSASPGGSADYSHAIPAILPSILPSPKAAASPAPTPAQSSRASILAYLGQAIGWYRFIALEEQTASDPADIIYTADNRQMADEILHLAFDYARAQAALIKATPGDQAHPVNENTAANSDLLQRLAAAQANVTGLAAKVAELNTRLKSAAVGARNLLSRELAVAQGQLDLAQSHVDSLNALIEYENGSSVGDSSRNGLSAQIDELEASLPHAGQDKAAEQKPDTTSANESLSPNAGFLARGEFLLTLQRRQQALDAALKMTADLAAASAAQREQLIVSLREIDEQSVQEANEATSSDIATVRETRDAFKQLAVRRKLVGTALQPLSKQIVTLNLYTTNLQRWRLAISRRFRAEVRNLILRAAVLGMLLGLVFLASLAWRKLAFRYVPDIQRRHQLMQLRRFAVGLVIVLILLFGLGGDLRVLATVMGFAAAGIALALQNVILSFAGYFYIGGRYGIRIGDRIQLAGVAGDVLEIGLFKLTLMELTNESNGRQPTGRIVVFPNSVVFQPNGNFFNQLPGSNYMWNELRLSLAPDCDYRLAEQRVLEVIGAVFSRFRDSIQRDYRNVESDLNVRFESPRPQSRLQFSDAGIEVVVRYPVPVQATAQAADEITRRLVDAINREPGLRLVPQRNPSLQRADPPSDNSVSASAEATVTPSGPSQSAAPPTTAPDANAGITPAAAALAGAAGIAAASAVAGASAPSAPPPAEPPKP